MPIILLKNDLEEIYRASHGWHANNVEKRVDDLSSKFVSKIYKTEGVTNGEMCLPTDNGVLQTMNFFTVLHLVLPLD